jgi:hypothetical protein
MRCRDGGGGGGEGAVRGVFQGSVRCDGWLVLLRSRTAAAVIQLLPGAKNQSSRSDRRVWADVAKSGMSAEQRG